VAARFRTQEGLASSTIVLAIAMSVLSIAFWLNVVDWWL
jgi:predicted permease